MTHRIRLAAGILALAGMLFSSLVAALQACDSPAGMQPAAGMASMSPHGGIDNPDCERHCKAAQAIDLAKPLPAALPLLVPPCSTERPFVRATPLRASQPCAPAFLADPSPPLTRFTVLRL